MRRVVNLTHQRLLELLSYDPETGVFTWRVTRGGTAIAGSSAGSLHPKGHVCIFIDGNRNVKAHQLAWFYMTGTWPTETIDHKNRRRDDNRWDNLRPASYALQNQNRTFKGVGLNRGRWRARIQVDGRSKFLGHFDSEHEATAAREAAKSLYHPNATGEA